MTDYRGQVLYEKFIHTIFEIVSYKTPTVYNVITYCTGCGRHEEELGVDFIDDHVNDSCFHVVQPGDIIIDRDGREVKLTHVTPFFKFDRVFGGTSYSYRLSYSEFFEYDWKFSSLINSPVEPIVNNKNRTTCFKCRCPTEQRRDFNDFSIREFCPRCKV